MIVVDFKGLLSLSDRLLGLGNQSIARADTQLAPVFVIRAVLVVASGDNTGAECSEDSKTKNLSRWSRMSVFVVMHR